MTSYEIRDPVEARTHLLHGLVLSRASALDADRVADALRWAMEVASDGSPLQPLGFIADIGHAALDCHTSSDRSQLQDVEGLDPTLTRRYEDYVLGKLYADARFQRAGDAAERYRGRERDQAIAYLVKQVRDRCRFGGVVLTPAAIKGLLKMPPEEVLQQAWEAVAHEGVSKRLIEDLQQIVAAVRSTGQLLGAEDVFELESGTALAGFAQRLALRQVLQVAQSLRRGLPDQKPRARARQHSVATRIFDEDRYPMGGFSSISNRGTTESLVRSELAYIDDSMRPDLFDIKFARNELLYYSRDENQFLRRRLSYVFLLYPDLVAVRIKDSHLPCQRIILLLASLYVCVGRLIDWLGQEAIRFEFWWVATKDHDEMPDERALTETLFHDQIVSGQVVIGSVPQAELRDRYQALARTSMCQTLSISVGDVDGLGDQRLAARMRIDRAEPTLLFDDESVEPPTASGVEGWQQQLDRLLSCWVI